MTETRAVPSTKGQFTGWHMLFVMVTFFGVIIGVNLFMAYSSVTTWTGLVVENSYVASQQFNTKLANARAQDSMGWQGGLDYADGRLIFTLRDGDGQTLVAQSVTISLSRPIGVSGDQQVELPLNASGDYALPLALDDGVWNAVILAQFADQPDYEHRARFVIGAE